MARSDYAEMILDWVGSDKLKLIDAATGWPSIIEWDSGDGTISIAMHVSQAGDYYRKPYEWRFQNPGGGASVDDTRGLPLLVGFDEADGDPILIVTDGSDRVDRTTRFSILFNKNILAEARERSVSRYVSTTGEIMYALRPKLLPSILEVLSAGEDLRERDLQQVASAAGFTDEQTDEAADRTRRATQVLVRDHKFSRNVRAAYSDTCAMCGIGVGLAVGAHIYPVSAPQCANVTQNGVSLCANHHIAYDNFDVWFDADTYAVRFSPTLLDAAKESGAVKAFIEGTFDVLNLPEEQSDRPARDWIEKRRAFYADRYDWLG